MKEAPVRSFTIYFMQHQYGVISRLEDFAARRALIAPTQGKEALRRSRSQDRLAVKLTERVPEDVVVAAGLALAGERYPGAAPEPYRVNAGLVLLGSEQATTYIVGQSDLFSHILKTYEQVKDQQIVLASQQPQSPPHVPLKFLPALDPDFDNDLRIGLNLRRLRDAVKGDNQKFQAVERVLRG